MASKKTASKSTSAKAGTKKAATKKATAAKKGGAKKGGVSPKRASKDRILARKISRASATLSPAQLQAKEAEERLQANLRASKKLLADLTRPNAVFRCSACDHMTKARSPACRECGTRNGYEPMPPGTKLPKRHKNYADPNDPLAGTGVVGLPGLDGLDGLGEGGKKGSGGEDGEPEFDDPDEFPDVYTLGEIEDEEVRRISTGMEGADLVFGGTKKEGFGLGPGEAYLLDGPPGCGKSTFTLQILGKIAEKGKVILFTAEETKKAIVRRAKRLGLYASKAVRKNLLIVETFDIDAVIEVIEDESPILVVIDSVQMFESNETSGQPGSEPQAKYMHEELVRQTTKDADIPVIFISQVTKQGQARGPQTYGHMVDTLLSFRYFDKEKKMADPRRVFEATKNREIGEGRSTSYFEMTGKGLVETAVSEEEIEAMSARKKRKKKDPFAQIEFGAGA